MSVSLVLAVQDRTVAGDLEDLLGAESGFVVRAVAATAGALLAAVLDHEPDAVLIHEDFGPQPALMVAKDLVDRLPWVGVVLLTREPSLELHTAAADVGVRGVAVLPPSLADLSARLGAAAWWSRNVRTGAQTRHARDDEAVLLAVAGAKGGVGTTSLATQLAFVAAGDRDRRVCLVDLNLFGCDLATYLGTTAHRSLGDLVDLSDELSAGVLLPVLYTHESGVRVLLAPEDIADGELVSSSLVRRTIGVLRTMFDVVVVDCGSHVTEAVLPALELADRVALVVTPDLLAVRAAHRLAESWEQLDVRRTDAVELVVNRVSRRTAVQPRLIAQTSAMRVCREGIPAAFGVLEPLTNEGASGLRGSRTLAGPFQRLAAHFGVEPPRPPRTRSWRRRSAAPADDAPPATVGAAWRTAAVGPADALVPVPAGDRDRGSMPVEVAASMALLALGLALLAQLGLLGLSAATLAVVTPEAAEQLAAGRSAPQVQRQLRDRGLPVLDDVAVRRSAGRVEVTLRVPTVVPGLDGRLSSDAQVVDRAP